jgi:hypothetical protein
MLFTWSSSGPYWIVVELIFESSNKRPFPSQDISKRRYTRKYIVVCLYLETEKVSCYYFRILILLLFNMDHSMHDDILVRLQVARGETTKQSTWSDDQERGMQTRQTLLLSNINSTTIQYGPLDAYGHGSWWYGPWWYGYGIAGSTRRDNKAKHLIWRPREGNANKTNIDKTSKDISWDGKGLLLLLSNINSTTIQYGPLDAYGHGSWWDNKAKHLIWRPREGNANKTNIDKTSKDLQL